MGGVFRLLEGGRAKAHVNPDFEVLPENYYDPQQMRCVKDFLQVVGFYGIWKDMETTYNLTPNFWFLSFMNSVDHWCVSRACGLETPVKMVRP